MARLATYYYSDSGQSGDETGDEEGDDQTPRINNKITISRTAIHLAICLAATTCTTFVVVEMMANFCCSFAVALTTRLAPLFAFVIYYPLLVWNCLSYWIIYLTQLAVVTAILLTITRRLRAFIDRLPGRFYDVIGEPLKLANSIACLFTATVIIKYTFPVFEAVMLSFLAVSLQYFIKSFIFILSFPAASFYYATYSICFIYSLGLIDSTLRCFTSYRSCLNLRQPSAFVERFGRLVFAGFFNRNNQHRH